MTDKTFPLKIWDDPRNTLVEDDHRLPKMRELYEGNFWHGEQLIYSNGRVFLTEESRGKLTTYYARSRLEENYAEATLSLWTPRGPSWIDFKESRVYPELKEEWSRLCEDGFTIEEHFRHIAAITHYMDCANLYCATDECNKVIDALEDKFHIDYVERFLARKDS